MNWVERTMAEEVDLRFLGEQIKRLQGDVRLLKSDMAQVRADSVKVESDVASVKADIARVETKLEVFREAVDDRFDRTDEFVNSHFGRLNGRIDVQSDQIKSIFDQLKAQSDQIRSIFDQLKEQSDRLNAQSSQFDAILSEIRSLKRS